MHEEIQSLLDQLASATSDAATLAAGLSDTEAGTRLSPESWSITESIDHLALTNTLYLAAMQSAAFSARIHGKLRRGPAVPGFLGRWFAAKIEPPIRPNFRIKTISKLKPDSAVTLEGAFASFKFSQQAIGQFIRDFADLDLASIRYTNPIVPGMNFSVASGLNIVLAHERRHLWQARTIRNAIESAALEPRKGNLP